MLSAIFRPTSGRQAFAAMLALVVAFLGVAVFSSLHKHQTANGRCSLNGYDQLMMGEAQAAQVDIRIVLLDLAEHSGNYVFQAVGVARSVLLRGPPTALHQSV